MIQFTAYGIPAPKGSTRAFMPKGARFPIVTEDNKHTRPWAAIVKDAAIKATELCGIGGKIAYSEYDPVRLNIVFYMPRPKSLPKRILFHTKKPDLDKLVRAVKDALTGVIWEDDSQVTDIAAAKLYVKDGSMPRAEIQIESLF